MRLRELLLVQTGAETEAQWTPEQVAEMRASIDGVPHGRVVQALRAFGLADLRADPLSPLPLELALADAISPPAATAPSAEAPGMRQPAPPMQRPAAVARPQAAPAPRTAQPPRREPTPPKGREYVPEELRKDLTNASAEDIARMLGSKAPVIPPASEAAAAPNGNGAAAPVTAGATTNGADLSMIVPELRKAARPRSVKLDALLNGSCEAVSWSDGVLTLGFYEDKFHKKGVEDAANRKIYEEIAAHILGAPVSIRCIIGEKPARAAKSALVQHAVQTHGAKIVSGDQE